MERFLNVFDNLLSEEYCQNFIRSINSEKFILIDNGICCYYRLEEQYHDLSTELWEKIKHILPTNYGKLLYVNDTFRISKYDSGMEFGNHKDGSYIDKNGNRSVFTINIFLNQNFESGETTFFDNDNNVIMKVKPKIGRASIFDGQIMHCGNKVINGTKYLLRTDVMTYKE